MDVHTGVHDPTADPLQWGWVMLISMAQDTTKSHRDVHSLCSHLKPCWCPSCFYPLLICLTCTSTQGLVDICCLWCHLSTCWSLHFCFGWGMCDFIGQWHSWRPNGYPLSEVLPEIVLLSMGLAASLGHVEMHDHYCHLRSCWCLWFLLPMMVCWCPRPILSLGWSFFVEKICLDVLGWCFHWIP